MSRVIAIANEKGGVAKTTTALSLAGALAETGRLVLGVDLDPQANLTLGLGVNPALPHPGISEVLLDSVPHPRAPGTQAALAGIVRPTAIPGLDLAPSGHEMLTAERFLSARQGPAHMPDKILARALEGLQHTPPYDYILLDCPPSLGAVTLEAMTAAHLAIIPTQPEYFAIHGLRSVLPAIRSLRGAANPNLNYRVLITMFDRRNRIHLTLSEQLRATFGEGVFNTVIEVDTKLRESTVLGLPITHSFPRSRSAAQYRLLAEELAQCEAGSPPGSEGRSETNVEAKARQERHTQSA